MKKIGHRPKKELKTKKELDADFFTIQETADILKVHHNTIRRAIKNNEIKAKKIGYVWRIPKEEITK